MFTRWETALRGWPDLALTWGLVAMGVFFILVGLFSPSRLFKAGALAYAVFP